MAPEGRRAAANAKEGRNGAAGEVNVMGVITALCTFPTPDYRKFHTNI